MWAYFKESWRGPLAQYLPKTKQTFGALYDSEYKHLSRTADEQDQKEKDIFGIYMDGLMAGTIGDEYKEYTEDRRNKCRL
jgi:hypothetical protein